MSKKRTNKKRTTKRATKSASTPRKKTTSKRKKTAPKKKTERKKKSTRQPAWTLEKDGVTNSMLQTWETCHEQCALSYIEGLTHVKLKEPLVFGSLFHACLEHEDTMEPLEAMRAFRDQTIEEHPRKPDYLAAFDHLMYQVNAVLPAYRQAYPKASEAKLVHAEKSFAIPVEHLGIKFSVRGKRDGEIEADGGLALRELKTKTTIDKDKIRYLLKSDLQTLIYLWSMWKEYGEAPKYLLYDVVKRPTLRVKRNQTLQAYYEEVHQHALERPDMYFCRWKVDPILESDLIRFEDTILNPLLRSFTSWWSQVRLNPFQRELSSLHHLNLPALSDPWKKSDFYDYLVLGRTDLYYRKSSPHPELEEYDNA